LRWWGEESRYLGLVVIVSDWGSSFTPFRIGRGIPTRSIGTRKRLFRRTLTEAEAQRQPAQVYAGLGAFFFCGIDHRTLSHIITGLLVNPRKQPIAHASRIFLIPWQLFLQRLVFQCGSDHCYHQRHSCWNDCPQGA